MEKPLIRLRLLTSRNFGLGTLACNFWSASHCTARSTSSRTTWQAQGYDAEQIGEVMAWTGLPQLLVIPFVPILMRRVDTRYIGVTAS